MAIIMERNDRFFMDDQIWKVQFVTTSGGTKSLKDLEEERWKKELSEWKEAPY